MSGLTGGDAADKEQALEREEEKIQEHAPEERSPQERAGEGEPKLTNAPTPPGNAEPRG